MFTVQGQNSNDKYPIRRPLRSSLNSMKPPLRQGLAQRGIQADVTTDCPPADVDYVVYAPSSTLQDFTPYTRCKAVLSLWAGVEKIVGNASLTQPLCRMVDSGLRRGHGGMGRGPYAAVPPGDGPAYRQSRSQLARKPPAPGAAIARSPFWAWAPWARPALPH